MSEELKTVVYTSQKKTNLFKEIKEILKDIKKSNFLAFQMAKRDIQAQYRQSFLGILWAFIPIIANSVVWIFLNSSGTVSINLPSNIPYVLFIIIGTIVWSVFVETLQTPINSINSARSIISKINFPKEALLVSSLYKLGFTLGLKLVVVIIFLIIYGINPILGMFSFLFYLLVISLFAIAIGILLTPIGLLYPDISRMITLGSQFLMFVTPVVFMVPKGGWTRIIFDINPLTYLVNDARNSLLDLGIESLSFSIILLSISIVILLIGLVVLRKSMHIIIEKLS